LSVTSAGSVDWALGDNNLDRPISNWISGGPTGAPMAEASQKVNDNGSLQGDSNVT
jgi:hypothetical protein